MQLREEQDREVQDIEQSLAETETPQERVKLFAEISELIVSQDIHRASELLDELLPIAKRAQRRGELQKEYAFLLRASGLRHAIQSKFDLAHKDFSEALKLSHKLGDRRFEAALLNKLGAVALSRSEYEIALGFFKRCGTIHLELEEMRGFVRNLNSMASVYGRIGRATESLAQFTEASRLAELYEDKVGLSNALAGIGIVQRDLGNLTAALASHTRSLALKQELNEIYGIGHSLNNIGIVYAGLRDWKRAIEYYERAVDMDRKAGSRKSEAGSLINMGEAYHKLGDQIRASEFLEQGCAIADDVGDRQFFSNGLGILADVTVAKGNPEKAVEYARTAKQIKEEIGDEEGKCETMLSLARALFALGEYVNAIESAESSYEIAKHIRAKNVISAAAKLLAEFHRTCGDNNLAFIWYETYHTINEEILLNEADRKLENLTAQLAREQAEKREEVLKIENQRMERELDLKTKHLTTLAMSIAQHSNFLDAVGKEIGSAVKETPKKRIEKLQSITKRVRQQSQSEQEWKSFEQQLENLNHDFIAKLGKKFPKLSPTELKICALLKIGLGSKEMSSVLCVTIRAVETYRLRIRKKLSLSQSDNLGSFIAGFN
jgi:tetratricopeptide (TPR) repeat protein